MPATVALAVYAGAAERREVSRVTGLFAIKPRVILEALAALLVIGPDEDEDVGRIVALVVLSPHAEVLRVTAAEIAAKDPIGTRCARVLREWKRAANLRGVRLLRAHRVASFASSNASASEVSRQR
jgi:hypothetical protein